MTRLVDVIARGGIQPPGVESATQDAVRARMEADLATAEIIACDNVTEYFYAGTDQEEWDIQEDFPNLAPPFKTFWMETTRPSKIVSEVDGVYQPLGMPFRWGALFKSAHIDATMAKQADVPDGSEWVLTASLVAQMSAKSPAIGPLVHQIILVNGDGSVTALPQWATALTGDQRAAESLRGMLNPFHLALSLMHCKNVTMSVEKPPHPDVARHYRKKYDREMVRYHTLDIQPMKKVLRSEGESDTKGLRTALHICRGHFKDYRESGLFGRHKGIYWWESQVRGSGEQGEVVKDYRVSR